MFVQKVKVNDGAVQTGYTQVNDVLELGRNLQLINTVYFKRGDGSHLALDIISSLRK